MKETLETTLLEFDKSAFLIDLVKHKSGSLYIEIMQTINVGKKSNQIIKINPSVITDIIKVLESYQSKIYSRPKNLLRDADQEKIQNRYLKGVSLEDLSLQFDYPTEEIEMVLRNRGIEIVSNKIPKSKYWKRRK